MTEARSTAPARTPTAGAISLQSLRIREYEDALAADFRDINLEWIEAMFRVEPIDRDVLEHPREYIIDRGGAILFVEAVGHGVVGVCALERTDDRAVELTKFGVRTEARGLKAGEFLLTAVIQRAAAMNADPLYLLTSTQCAAAVHLYEKVGFRHDATIMRRWGGTYARCNVAMRYGATLPT